MKGSGAEESVKRTSGQRLSDIKPVETPGFTASWKKSLPVTLVH